MSDQTHLHQRQRPVKPAAVGERPAAVIADIGARLRRTRSPGQLHALADAAVHDFLVLRANFRAIGGLDYVGRLADAPTQVTNAYVALQVATLTLSAITRALPPDGRTVLDAPIGHVVD